MAKLIVEFDDDDLSDTKKLPLSSVDDTSSSEEGPPGYDESNRVYAEKGLIVDLSDVDKKKRKLEQERSRRLEMEAVVFRVKVILH